LDGGGSGDSAALPAFPLEYEADNDKDDDDDDDDDEEDNDDFISESISSSGMQTKQLFVKEG
jgi:hypothetical protein